MFKLLYFIFHDELQIGAITSNSKSPNLLRSTKKYVINESHINGVIADKIDRFSSNDCKTPS